ncbi:MAG: hypothetical protein NUV81_00745, partial [bacterium]|nr:hypothetical protein [bacterium]
GRETGKKEERETKNNEDQKAKIVREDKTSVVRTFAKGSLWTGAFLGGSLLIGVGLFFKGLSWGLGKLEKWLDWTINTSFDQKIKYYAGLAELKPLDSLTKWMNDRMDRKNAEKKKPTQ